MRESPQIGLTGVPSRVAWLYAVCAAAWIVLSDLAVVLAMDGDTSDLWTDIGKGLLFVAASGGLLYLLLRRGLDREMAVRAELEASHARFNSAVAHLPFTFAIYDADRRFRFLNRQGLLNARKPLDAVLGRRDEELFPLEMVNAYLPALNRVLETRQPQTEVVEIPGPSGPAHLAYTFTPLLNADGTLREVLAVTNDMTGVVRNDRRVRQLNRTLTAISAANSVLVRSTDEAALLKDFCEALVEPTGHRLVWVGLVTPGDPNVRVAAQAGQAPEYLTGIEIRCDDTPSGRGPSGLAIRTGRPQVCADFTTDERMLKWRERAAKAGMRSSIAMPLRAAGSMMGALTLYSSEPNRFDEDEMKLLVELADDLAFGLAALRQKAQLEATTRQLRESEERLRTLKLVIDQSESIAYVARLAPGWPVEFVSDNAVRFGYQPTDLLTGRVSFPSLVHPEDLPGLQAVTERTIAEHARDFTAEYRLFDAHGGTRWVRDFCVVVRNEAGEATHLQGVLTEITEQRLAADQLVWRTAFFEAQVDSALDGILVVDSQGKKILQNQRFNELWKFPPDIIAEQDDRRQLEYATSKTRNPQQFVERAVWLYAHPDEVSREEIVLLDGTIMDRYSSPVRGKDGRHFGRIWTFRDVTAQKHAEAQMRDALAYLGALLEASPVGIVSFDETGQAQTVNHAAARIVGATPEQLLAQNFRRIESWRATGMLAAAEKALERRQSEQLEAHFITTFGKEVWMAVQFVPFQRGEAWHLLFLMTDISEQARAIAQLRLQSAALEAAANAIVITDKQGTILWANAAFTKTTGYPLAEVVGQNPRLLKSGQHPREFYEGMWKTILSGRVWHGELCNRRKDGSLHNEEMTIAPVRDHAGRVTHFIAIKQDITERKSLEKQFLRAQRLEGIGLLAGGIAHDLNNVLAPILMGADLLKLVSRDEQTIHQLDGIVQSARRGADIVKQVLTFARGIEGERVVLHPKHVIKEMVRMARETFPRNIALSADIPGDLWPVVGDATQLHQVLLNLSVNARDALAEGGELIYSAANVEVDDTLVHANPGAKPGPHVVLRIKDTGTGIPPEVLDRIFEPFFTTKELGKGTGLGLSTVVGIVRSHGGFVTVNSQVGRGTTFEVYLPASPEAAGQLVAAQPEPPPRGNGELVLVVDDEASILQVTRRMLEAHGYRVLTADDGTTALTQMSQRACEVALVITDVMMPFMDGVQLIRALRKLSPEVKVIASSGALGMPGQKDRTDEVLALGVKHILHKPYSVEALLRTVHAELHPNTPKA